MILPGRRRMIDHPGGRWMITGTSRGLGAALATRAHAELGAEVLGVDRSPAAVSGCRHVVADLATEAGRNRAVELIEEWRPTVLVNNAGTNQSRRVADTPPSMIEEIVEVGFTTPFHLMGAMARVHQDSDRDAWIINIVSPYRLLGIRTHSLYCATKAALSRAGEALAVEEGLGGALTTVSVVPGVFESGFRPLEPHDAWLVRAHRTLRRRTADDVASDLLRRLRRGTHRPHWTVRLGWDGLAFEVIARTMTNDATLVAIDALIGQRQPDQQPVATRDRQATAE
jgi:NAD(P)-dependent dehydrogenase (short-subunit alcohol dehydrogenase family)